MALFWVQVTEPGHPARVVPVTEPVEVGRDCDGLLLDDPTVSRRHLVLDPSGEALVCTDLGSANGTTVGGVRVTDPVTLGVGDVVRLGETELVVHEGRETVADETTAGSGVVVEALDRPSEAMRDLSRASSKTYRPTP